jgi:hypothetical protein
MKAWMVRIAAVCAFVMLLSMVAAAQKPTNIAGKWETSFTRPDGQTMTSTITFEQDGEKLKGSIEGGRGPAAALEGSVKGNKVTFKVTRQGRDGQSVTTEYNATVEGDTMKGTRVTGDRSSEFSAKKAK